MYVEKFVLCGDGNGWVVLEVLYSLFYCYTWESLLALSKLAGTLQESLEINWQLINIHPGVVVSIKYCSCVFFRCSNLPLHLSPSCNNSQPHEKGGKNQVPDISIKKFSHFSISSCCMAYTNPFDVAVRQN